MTVANQKNLRTAVTDRRYNFQFPDGMLQKLKIILASAATLWQSILPMNNTFVVRRISIPLAISCAALLLAGAGAVKARAQAANNPAVAPDSAADVSQFPSLDKLPGKVPPTVWTGLAGVWARDHAQWKATASNDVGAVVFLGDSITEGWRTLARDFPKLKVANRGIGGDITSGVLYRLKADVLSLKPAAIVLLIGTNDVGDGASGEDVAANIQLILLAIKNTNPKTKVIVCKVMPRADGNVAIYAEKIQKANSLVEQFVKGQPNFAMCDTWGIYADEKGNPNAADFNPDHLHLNAAGYAVWKTALDPVLASLQVQTGTAQ
jgi:lysophospholipase L1-like esterase